jgi:hypothetical protein
MQSIMEWTSAEREIMNDFNHIALANSLLSPLFGGYSMIPDGSFAAGAGTLVLCGKPFILHTLSLYV